VINADLNHAVLFDHDGIDEYRDENVSHDSLFGVTCCGASISPDLKYSLIGDFTGNVHLFKHA